MRRFTGRGLFLFKYAHDEALASGQSLVTSRHIAQALSIDRTSVIGNVFQVHSVRIPHVSKEHKQYSKLDESQYEEWSGLGGKVALEIEPRMPRLFLEIDAAMQNTHLGRTYHCIGPEHVFLGLLRCPWTAGYDILQTYVRDAGITPAQLRKELMGLVGA